MLLSYDARKHLRRRLAGYLAGPEWQLIVHDAHLPLSRIDAGGSAEVRWFHVLELAEAHGRDALRRLLAASLEAAPALAEDPVFTATSQLLAGGSSGAPLSTTSLSTVPVSTAPLSTAPLSTAPLSTSPLSTAPLSATPFLTAPGPSTTPSAPRAFISHRTADADEAQRLAEQLEARGVEVLLDVWDIGVGDSIVGWMNQAVSNAAFVVLCYSAHGVDAPWIAREWQAALARQLNGQRLRILPVYLTGRRGPALLEDVLAADWMSDPSRAVDALCRAMFQRRRP